MALKMHSSPVRARLPVSYSTEIGRIIVRWALVEWHLKRLAYDILQISPKAGRVAVQEPRVEDYITMLQDLLALRKIRLDIDWKLLRKELGEIASFRNKLAHGIWVKHPGTKTPVLQETKGKHPNEPDATQRKARINPKALRVTLANLKDYRKRTDAAAHALRRLRDDLAPALQAPPAESP